MPFIKVPWSSTPAQRVQIKQTGGQIASLRGGDKAPDPPLGVRAQPSPNSVTVFWEYSGNAPTQPAFKFRVYLSTESNLYREVSGDVRQIVIPRSDVNTPHGGVNVFVSAANGVGESRKVFTQCTPGQVSPATDLSAKGSIPPVLTTGFSYVSDTTSITWSWSNLQVLRADGSTQTVPDGSVTITGLTAGTIYYAYPYLNDVSGLPPSQQGVQWIVPGQVGNPQILWTNRINSSVQCQNLLGRIPLSQGPITASTVSSGTGGGGDGGTGLCIRSTMLVETRDRGIIPASEVKVGDFLLGPDGFNEVTFAQERPQDVFIRVTVAGGSIEVTPSHAFSALNAASEAVGVRAADLTVQHQLRTRTGAAFIEKIEVVKVSGAKMVLTVEPSHLFYAGETAPQIVTHNFWIGS